jgi:hypothetical protein
VRQHPSPKTSTGPKSSNKTTSRFRLLSRQMINRTNNT